MFLLLFYFIISFFILVRKPFEDHVFNLEILIIRQDHQEEK